MAVGFSDGSAVADGAALGSSSTKAKPVRSEMETSTAILFGSPPSLSVTSKKPSGVTSRTVYSPGLSPPNSKTPFAFVVVVLISVPD